MNITLTPARLTWVADHSVLLARRPNALGRFCRCAIVPSVLVGLGHFGEVCIQLCNINQSLRSQFTCTILPHRCALSVVVQDRLLAGCAETILKQRVNVDGVANVMFGSQVWTRWVR